jgi:hypothetical protein
MSPENRHLNFAAAVRAGNPTPQTPPSSVAKPVDHVRERPSAFVPPFTAGWSAVGYETGADEYSGSRRSSIVEGISDEGWTVVGRWSCN